MSRDIVDIALVEITSVSQGNKELETIVSMTINTPEPTTAVKVMRRKRRALGFTSGVPDFSMDLECVLEAGESPEVDWGALKRTRETFLLTWEENDGGRRQSAIDCRVVDETKTFGENGETKHSVKLIYLDQKDA